MIIVLGLSACGLFEDKTKSDNDTPILTEDPVVTEEESNVPVVSEDDDNKDNPSEIEEKKYENATFKEVVITEKEHFIVTGKAQVFEGVFQYAIVAGDETLKEGIYQTDGAPAWGNFEIVIDKELASTEGATLELFFYSPKDGAKTNVLEIPLN